MSGSNSVLDSTHVDSNDDISDASLPLLDPTAARKQRADQVKQISALEARFYDEVSHDPIAELNIRSNRPPRFIHRNSQQSNVSVFDEPTQIFEDDEPSQQQPSSEPSTEDHHVSTETADETRPPSPHSTTNVTPPIETHPSCNDNVPTGQQDDTSPTPTGTINLCDTPPARDASDSISANELPIVSVERPPSSTASLLPPVRRVEINGVMIPLQTLPTGLEATTAWDPVLPHQDLNDELFLEMTKKSKTNLKLSERVDMLYAFVDNKKDLSHWLHDDLKKLDSLDLLDTILKKTNKSRYRTRLYPLALKLFCFHKLLARSDELRGAWGIRGRSNEPEEIRTFREWLEKLKAKVVERAMDNSVKPAKTGRKKKQDTYQQPGGGLTLFPISVRIKKDDPKWNFKREPEPCPMCGHNMLVLVDTPDALFKQLQLRKKDYEFSRAKWDHGGKKKNEEPMQPKGCNEPYMVCMCCVSKCVDRYTGSGCIVCEGYAKDSPEGMVPWDKDTAMCLCSPCRCPCGVYFKRTAWQSVATQAEEDKIAKQESQLAKRTKYVEGQQAFANLLSATKNAATQNGLASMSHGLLTNSEMNDDVAMRSELQDHLPNPSRLVVLDGADVPIDSLRKGKKKTNDSNKFYNNDLDPNIRREFSFPTPPHHHPPAIELMKDEKRTSADVVPPPSIHRFSPPRKQITHHAAGESLFIQRQRTHHNGVYYPTTTSIAGESTIPASITTAQPINYECFRTYRIAIVNRIVDQAESSEQEFMSLNRLHDILSGTPEDPAACTIITMAHDQMATGDDRWSDEVRISININNMLKMLRFCKKL